MALLIRGTGRPAAYKLADGTRVPSVTTITGARKTGIEGLLVWANRLGQEGKDHRDARKMAGDSGSFAHAMVENAIHDKPPMEGLVIDDEQVRLLAETGFHAWEEWSKVMSVVYVSTEQPMVSEKHRYGGTPDAIGIIDGKLALWDWKTSNGVYGDYLIQLAAYDALWSEANPGNPLHGWYILRFGKEHGDFHCHSYPRSVIDVGWKAFLLLRQLYDADQQLGKVVR